MMPPLFLRDKTRYVKSAKCIGNCSVGGGVGYSNKVYPMNKRTFDWSLQNIEVHVFCLGFSFWISDFYFFVGRLIGDFSFSL